MYCSVQDVIDRVGAVGVVNIGDGVGDSDESSSSESSTINQANLDLIQASIDEAAVEINEALLPWIKDTSAAVGNEWLRYKCRDIACEILCSQKGHDIPESFIESATRARQKLELVRRGKTSSVGMRVPGLVYPGDNDTTTRQVIGMPVVANPLR